MAIKVKRNRTYTFTIHDEADIATVTFSFPFTEEKKYNKKYLQAIGDKSKERTQEEIVQTSMNAYHTSQRTCLSAWTGFEDDNGNKLPCTDAKGNIIEENQKMVYEYVLSNEELSNKVTLAQGGSLSEKNLTIGSPLVSSSDGVPIDAELANSLGNVSTVDMSLSEE